MQLAFGSLMILIVLHVINNYYEKGTVGLYFPCGSFHRCPVQKTLICQHFSRTVMSFFQKSSYFHADVLEFLGLNPSDRHWHPLPFTKKPLHPRLSFVGTIPSFFSRVAQTTDRTLL